MQYLPENPRDTALGRWFYQLANFIDLSRRRRNDLYPSLIAKPSGLDAHTLDLAGVSLQLLLECIHVHGQGRHNLPIGHTKRQRLTAQQSIPGLTLLTQCLGLCAHIQNDLP
ncbi:hypothetical protein D3C79_877140 [compost metagenome]